MRGDRVIGPRQPGDTVEQNDHVPLVLDQSPRFLDHHLRHLHVTSRRLVEGRTDHLALDRTQHIGNFLGALIDQQYDENGLGVVGGNRVGDLLQKHGFAGEGRRHDQPALSLADRREQIENARGHVLLVVLELKAIGWMQGGQILEDRLLLRHFRIIEIDSLYPQQREILLVILRRADLTRNGIPRAQAEAFYLRVGHVDIVGTGQVVVARRAQEAKALF